MNLPFPINEHIVGKRLGRVVLGDNRGVLVQQDCKSIPTTLDQRLDLAGGARVIGADGDDLKASGLELTIHLVQMWHLELAWPTPSGPEIDEYDLSFVAGKADLLAINVAQGEVRSRLATEGCTRGTEHSE